MLANVCLFVRLLAYSVGCIDYLKIIQARDSIESMFAHGGRHVFGAKRTFVAPTNIMRYIHTARPIKHCSGAINEHGQEYAIVGQDHFPIGTAIV